MGLFNKKKTGGLADVIRCDEKDYLIWKWHPKDTVAGENKRENEIRYGSKLRVKDGEVAVFVYKQKNGKYQDYIEGPFDQKLKTANFPILSTIIGWNFDGESPFQAEVYFINLAKIVQVKFAVPYFDIYDPRFIDFGVPVAVRGTVTFSIKDYKEFIKLHRLLDFNLEDFKLQIKDVVARYVKDAVANAPSMHNIPAVAIESKTSFINDSVELDIKDRLSENFGVTVSGVDIGAIEIDKSSAGYQSLKAITKDVTTQTIQAQTMANIENYAETLRINREEMQYAKHKQTQTENLGAYQIEKQAEVGVAGADALGKMGSNGAGNVDLGGNAGFNPATMMASMAVGGVVGQNIANVMSNTINGNTIGAVPPPISEETYFVVKGGKQTGPFNFTKIKEMINSGELISETLVWKQDLKDWVKARDLDEINSLIPPTIPKK